MTSDLSRRFNYALRGVFHLLMTLVFCSLANIGVNTPTVSASSLSPNVANDTLSSWDPPGFAGNGAEGTRSIAPVWNGTEATTYTPITLAPSLWSNVTTNAFSGVQWEWGKGALDLNNPNNAYSIAWGDTGNGSDLSRIASDGASDELSAPRYYNHSTITFIVARLNSGVNLTLYGALGSTYNHRGNEITAANDERGASTTFALTSTPNGRIGSAFPWTLQRSSANGSGDVQLTTSTGNLANAWAGTTPALVPGPLSLFLFEVEGGGNTSGRTQLIPTVIPTDWDWPEDTAYTPVTFASSFSLVDPPLLLGISGNRSENFQIAPVATRVYDAVLYATSLLERRFNKDFSLSAIHTKLEVFTTRIHKVPSSERTPVVSSLLLNITADPFPRDSGQEDSQLFASVRVANASYGDLKLRNVLPFNWPKSYWG